MSQTHDQPKQEIDVDALLRERVIAIDDALSAANDASDRIAQSRLATKDAINNFIGLIMNVRKQEIDALNARITALKEENSALNDEIASLKAKVAQVAEDVPAETPVEA